MTRPAGDLSDGRPDDVDRAPAARSTRDPASCASAWSAGSRALRRARACRRSPSRRQRHVERDAALRRGWSEGGARRAPRSSPASRPTRPPFRCSPSYDLERQFRMMRRSRELDALPVPRVLWSETRPGALGAPFFVMERIEGEVPPDILPYTFGRAGSRRARPSSGAAPGGDGRAARRAAPHRPPGGALRVPRLARPGATPLRRHVEEQRGYYDWVVADGRRSPLLERGFAWLDANWPEHEGPTVLSWGDSRIGNVLYRDFEPVGGARLGDGGARPARARRRLADLAARLLRGPRPARACPACPTSSAATTWPRATRSRPATRRATSTSTRCTPRCGTASSCSACAPRSHFGEAELPADVDDMIPHRRMLERMLAGSYWV